MLVRKPPPDVDALLASGVLLRAAVMPRQPFLIGEEVRSRWNYWAPWYGVVTDAAWTWSVDVWYGPTVSAPRVRTLDWYWEVEVRLLRSRRGVPIRKRWVRRSANWFRRASDYSSSL